jgi:heme exporter protein C
VTSQPSHDERADAVAVDERADAVVVDAPRGTGSKGTRILGLIVLAGIALGAYLALISSPPDELMGDSVRLIYIHVPVVTVAYLGCTLVTLASVMFLWKKSQWWDVTAAAAAEIALVFTCLTLVTGAIWGKPTWGTFWVWDPRLTATAMLALLLFGYQAVRRLPGDLTSRSRRSAIVGLLVLPNVFLDNRAVTWWRSLHQGTTILNTLQPKIHDQMAFALVFNMAVGLALAAWLMIHRWRLVWLEQQVEASELDDAIAERRAEGAPAGRAEGARPDRAVTGSASPVTEPTPTSARSEVQP